MITVVAFKKRKSSVEFVPDVPHPPHAGAGVLLRQRPRGPAPHLQGGARDWWPGRGSPGHLRQHPLLKTVRSACTVKIFDVFRKLFDVF